MNNDEERWAPLPEFEGRYEISTHGRIRNPRWKNRLVTAPITKYGYRVAMLRLNGKQRGIRLGRWVAMTFIPNPENKTEVNHKNGVKTDDSVGNLEWVTARENQLHAAHVLGRIGENTGPAKLTDEAVINARNVLYYTKTNAEIAAILGVKQTAIGRMMTGRTWPHLNHIAPPKSMKDSFYRQRNKLPKIKAHD